MWADKEEFKEIEDWEEAEKPEEEEEVEGEGARAKMIIIKLIQINNIHIYLNAVM